MSKLYNICLARGGGGLERMFLNYDEILGNHINILSCDSWVLKNIKSNNYIIVNKCNVIYKLFKLINISGKSLFICHCKRSLYYLDILKWYFGSQIITIFVNHNNNIKKKVLSADYSIIISSKMKKKFIEKKYNEQKIFTLNNFSIREKREIFLKKSIKNIAFIGRLGLEKGCFKMITQLTNILVNRNLKLNIYGDGIEFNKILDYIKQNNLFKYIELHGWIDNISKCYENNDLIVVPSIYESFGVVIIDAFYYNCPCIISNNVFINNEIIFNENNCLTYDINNENELGEKIHKLINNIDLFKKIQINGFDTFNEKLNHHIAKNRLNDTIYEILKKEKINPIKKLSFYVLTYNSEKHIYNVLNSIKNIVNEIIVVDSGSIDNTKNICKEFTDKIYYHDFKDGFTKSRKYAESLCNYNWILYLDSDEIPTKELINEIIEIKKGLNQNKYYAVSFYWKPIMWFEDKPHWFTPKRKVIRMYNKLKCTYIDHPYWDIPKVNKKNVLQTKNYYDHYGLNSINNYYDKIINRNYGEWIIEKNSKLNIIILLFRLILEFPLAFLKAYFLKILFIYGFTGILMSFIYAYSRFLRIYFTIINL